MALKLYSFLLNILLKLYTPYSFSGPFPSINNSAWIYSADTFPGLLSRIKILEGWLEIYFIQDFSVLGVWINIIMSEPFLPDTARHGLVLLENRTAIPPRLQKIPPSLPSWIKPHPPSHSKHYTRPPTLLSWNS